METPTVCAVCQQVIVGAPAKGAVAAHLRYCRAAIKKKAAAGFSARVLADIANVCNTRRTHQHAARAEVLKSSTTEEEPIAHHGQRDGSPDGADEAVDVHYQEDTQHPFDSSGPEEQAELGGVQDTTGDTPEHNDDDSDDGDTEPLYPSAPAYIEDQLEYDDLVAWMLLDMTNVVKKKVFIVLKMLAILANKGPESNPLHRSRIQTVEGFERYMKDKVNTFFCKMTAKEVPIVSTRPELRELAPVPLFIRSLPDVLACCLASPDIDNANVNLDPMPVQGEHWKTRSNPDDDGRVNCFMQGTFIHKAKQVSFPINRSY